MIGMGAANVSSYRLLKAYGVDPVQIVACDTRGTLHRNRSDVEQAADRVSGRSGPFARKPTGRSLLGELKTRFAVPTCASHSVPPDLG